MTSLHRKTWITHNGPIPLDEEGRTMEIHHIDGNHKNNNIDNLKLVTIKQHFDEHFTRGDWGACVLIAKRMNLPTDYVSTIQKGKKRPGVGGAKRGRIPWNKGVTGYQLKCNRKGKRHSSTLKLPDIINIRTLYRTTNYHKEYFEVINSKKGGPKPSYEWFASKQIKRSNYPIVCTNTIHNIITRKSWTDV
jgi:hypothetical protein